MKREQIQQKAAALDLEFARLEDASIEVRGMMALAAGFIRYSAHTGSVPSESETDDVAFVLESYGERLSNALWNLRVTGIDLLQAPGMRETPTVRSRQRR